MNGSKKVKGKKMNQFKQLLIEKHLSYNDISKLTGISERALIRYANGQSVPNFENAIKILKVFQNEKVDIFRFFGNN